ncbi:hypothetical protein L1887_50277 [Cichorium endivia]|nr:hypothetical protein L1887_50277 [Cichorium endivia]
MPPVTVSFTPRSVSAATPFGDPASLPGFTPSSLTESSPAFGHANHKTPRTPFSPVEEYRDGAAIVGSEAGNHHAGESAQLDGRYAHLAPQDQAGFPAAAGSNTTLFGKFASRPKSTAVLHALPNAANALSPDQNVQDEGKCDSASFSSRFALRPSRASPPKAVARRGQALLQLRRDRNSKMSPGQAVTTGGRHGGQRGLDAASTPRSSDDIAIARRASVSDSDSSSSEDDDEASDDAHSDSDVTEVTLSPEDQESMKRCSRHIVASYLCGASGASSEGEATSSHQRAALLNPATTSSPMLRAVDAGSDGSDIATREKLEVLAAMACALRITHGSESKPSTQSSTHSDGFLEQEALPTLQGPCCQRGLVACGSGDRGRRCAGGGAGTDEHRGGLSRLGGGGAAVGVEPVGQVEAVSSQRAQARGGESAADACVSGVARRDCGVARAAAAGHVVIYALQPPGSTTCAASGFWRAIAARGGSARDACRAGGRACGASDCAPDQPSDDDRERQSRFRTAERCDSQAGIFGVRPVASTGQATTGQVDEALMLHVSYRVCADGAAKMVVVSAMDERGGSSDVDVLVGDAEGWIGQGVAVCDWPSEPCTSLVATGDFEHRADEPVGAARMAIVRRSVLYPDAGWEAGGGECGTAVRASG